MKIPTGFFTSILLSIILNNGCTILATKEAVIGCQVADGATTLYAIHHGAMELSPIPVPAILAFKVFIIVWALQYSKEEWEREDKASRAVIAAAGCVPAASNLNVIRTLPK
jgi:hypothetical protein